ncbi:MAG TPA: pre-peptidase C-terminal domain-containing protein [Phycisphaerae bacterium]|nr:pre-peptidase C-terminal domain-containing protein [Phycisphaerae bacterium]
MKHRPDRRLSRSFRNHLIESLESRVLMTALTGTAHTQFVVEHATPIRTDASFAPNGLTPALIRQAYGINQAMFGSVAGDGTGQTIAIIDAYNAPTIVQDLHTFDALYGLADPTLVRINQNGGATLPGNDPSGRGNSWAVETSLDVEWAHALAPKAKIVLVEANSASDSDLFAAINTARHYAGVSVISMSWGGDESSSDASLNSYFTTPTGHTGVTFLASSGDSGAYNTSTTKKVGFPAASPNVVAVGGTYLTVDSSGNYLSESGWGSGTTSFRNGGSGGGISTVQTQPAYQHGVVTQSATKRALPDVAFDADPNSGVAVIDSYDFGNSTPVPIGGTSLAAPMWAGVIAIADQGRALSGLGTLDGATQTLPAIYALPSADFHDVTTGNNGYAAGAGFDLVTGRGTPIVNLVVRDLAGQTSPVTPPTTLTPVVNSFAASPGTVVAGTTISLTANASETGGSISNVRFYGEANGVSGLQTSTDLLIGTGAQNGSTFTATFSTTGLTPGTYTFYAVATDASGNSSTVSTATLTVQAPAPSNDSLAGGTILSGTSVSTSGSNTSATKESGEPNHAGNVGGHSLWYTWTATSSGTVAIDTHGSSFDTLLAVYTGNAVNALTRVASNDDDLANSTRTSKVTFNAVAGTTYHIAVDGYNGARGTISLHLQQTLAPQNAFFASAIMLTGNTVAWSGTNIGAARESGDPATIAGNGGGSPIWLTWTPTTTHVATVSTAGSNFDTLVGVYTGSSLGTLSQVAANDDNPNHLTTTSLVSFNAVAGVTYRILIDGYNAAQGTIALNIS